MAECLASNQRTMGSIPSARTPRLLVQRCGFEPRLLAFDSLAGCLLIRGSNCWSLRLALNQKVAGSIPVPGAVVVLCWFSDLVVTQVDAGSIPVDHLNGRYPAG